MKKCRCKTINPISSFNNFSFGFNKIQAEAGEPAPVCSLLLDQFPGAKVAYSLRLLDCDYTGPLCKIRRVNDDLTKDFYPDDNNMLSLNSTDGAGTTLGAWITIFNGFIDTWYDQSGNNNFVTQLIKGSQPQIVSAGTVITKNGLPTVYFGNGDIHLLNTLDIMKSEYIAFSVSSSELDEVPGGVYESVDISATNTRIVKLADTRNVQKRCFIFIGTSHDDLAVDTPDTYYLDSFYRVGNTAYDYQNGISQGTLDVTGKVTTALDTLVLGKQTASGVYFTGWMPELIIYDSDNSANRATIETNINAYYSIY